LKYLKACIDLDAVMLLVL